MNWPRAWLWTSVLLTATAVLCVVALAPPAGTPPVWALSWLLFTGSSVHVASTAWLFTLPAVRAYARGHPARCLWIPAGLAVIAAVAAAAVSPAAFQWLLLPYFGWQFFHYQKQNVGMAALAASAQRVGPLLPAERRPLLLAGGSAIAALAARPGLLGLQVAPFTRALFPLAGVAYCVAVVAGLVAIARRPRSRRPAGFCATYLTCMFFVLPVFGFSSPYAAVGGMTVAHGLQYLLLVSLIAGGRAPAGTSAGARPSAYLGVVMAHFVIDGGLWRMRDPLARRFVSAHLPFLAPPAAQAPVAARAAGAGPAAQAAPSEGVIPVPAAAPAPAAELQAGPHAPTDGSPADIGCTA